MAKVTIEIDRPEGYEDVAPELVAEDFLKTPTDAAWNWRIAELEGDLHIARMQLQRVDEVLVGSYGDIPRLSAGDARRMLRNIAYIVNPTRQLK